jgi:hypothetical protein
MRGLPGMVRKPQRQRRPVKPVDRDVVYGRVRWAYIAAASVFVFAAAYAIAYRLWPVFIVAAALAGWTAGRGRRALRHFRRP